MNSTITTTTAAVGALADRVVAAGVQAAMVVAFQACNEVTP